jgi:hypothetical protein
MAHQNADKRCFRIEQNGQCIQQVTEVLGILAHVFADKVPALLARKSRVPLNVRNGPFLEVTPHWAAEVDRAREATKTAVRVPIDWRKR